MGIIMIAEEYVVPLFASNPFCVYLTAVQSLGNPKAPFAACIAELAAICSASILLAIIAGYHGVVFLTPFAWLLADLIVVTAYFMMMRRRRAST